jgi:hypothetical protein
MRENLLGWQWSLYEKGHTTRGNLLLHLFTAPLFVVGTALLLSGVAVPRLAVIGGALMALALVAQGRGHNGEGERPVPFQGPMDFVSRFFAEQFVTFPRFVLSGGWAKAWKAAGR